MYNKVIISEHAGAKIDRLILNQNKEVGFYGTIEYKDQTIIVTDIMLYPQIVTGVTVNTDDARMAQWFIGNAPTINSIRFHGHSHVNMGTTPSGVDTSFYKNLVANLQPNEVYVFMIFNKRNITTSMIYQQGQFYKIPVVWEIDESLDYSQIEEYIEPLPVMKLQKSPSSRHYRRCHPNKKKRKDKPGMVISERTYYADDDWIEEIISKYHSYKPQEPRINPWWNH